MGTGHNGRKAAGVPTAVPLASNGQQRRKYPRVPQNNLAVMLTITRFLIFTVKIFLCHDDRFDIKRFPVKRTCRETPLECACRTRVEKPKTPRAQRSLREEQWSHVLDERVANEFRVLSLARLEYVLRFDWSVHLKPTRATLPILMLLNTTEGFIKGVFYPSM